MPTTHSRPPRRSGRSLPAVTRPMLVGAVVLLTMAVGSPAVGRAVADPGAPGDVLVGQDAVGQDAAQTMVPAYLRAAHLVSDVGTVDVRLSPFSAEGGDLTAGESAPALAESASYGAVSAYSAVAPESYAVSVRQTGQGLSGEPLLASALTLESGRSYTVVAVGPPGSAEIQLLEDDVSPPPTGQAELRLVSAVPDARVLVDGTEVVGLATPASDSEYVDVAAGKQTLEVNDGTTTATQEVSLAAGSSYTLFATPGGDGQLQLQTVLDRAAVEVVPVGGIDTGGGWLAGQEARAASNPLAVAALGAAGVLTLLLLVLLPRRRTSPLPA